MFTSIPEDLHWHVLYPSMRLPHFIWNFWSLINHSLWQLEVMSFCACEFPTSSHCSIFRQPDFPGRFVHKGKGVRSIKFLTWSREKAGFLIIFLIFLVWKFGNLQHIVSAYEWDLGWILLQLHSENCSSWQMSISILVHDCVWESIWLLR